MLKGRGTSSNLNNKFNQLQHTTEHIEGVDEPIQESNQSKIIYINAKTAINEVKSPDIPLDYSLNPYQGCEHGCIYCYARPTHHYWGYNSGLDFERQLLVKKNILSVFEKELQHPNYICKPIMLSGNTDCYQPIEAKEKLTQGILQLALKYKQPIGLITKNALVKRDLPILEALHQEQLIHVAISITSADEKIRGVLEPRTSTYATKLATIEKMAEKNIPVLVMVAPIIPSINDNEIPRILKDIADAGATTAYYTMARLNHDLQGIFEEWLAIHFPNKKDKVIAQIKDIHGGQVEDHRMHQRMIGEGVYAKYIKQIFEIHKKKYNLNQKMPNLNSSSFVKTKRGQLPLF